MDTTILKSKDLSKRGVRRTRRSLFEAYIDACRTHGKSKIIVTDGDERTFTYADILRAAFALSDPLKAATEEGEAVGILLPTGVGSVIALLSIHAAGRIPAMLNFTAGIKNLTAAAKTAPLKTVVTARKFVEIGGLSALFRAQPVRR